MGEIRITDNVVIYNDIERGWIQGKTQPIWHKKVYHMWIDTWRRIYGDIRYFGSLIHPSFKYLSNYMKWIESQPRFKEFCNTCDNTKWSVDKDSKYLGNKNYYPEYMTLMLGSDNSRESITRNGNPMLKEEYVRKFMKPVIGIPLDKTKKIILTLGRNDVSKYGFNPCNVSNCLAKRYKFHKDYKWYRVTYKHNKTYRIKGE